MAKNACAQVALDHVASVRVRLWRLWQPGVTDVTLLENIGPQPSSRDSKRLVQPEYVPLSFVSGYGGKSPLEREGFDHEHQNDLAA